MVDDSDIFIVVGISCYVIALCLLMCGAGRFLYTNRSERDIILEYSRSVFMEWFMAIVWGILALHVTLHKNLREGEQRYPKMTGAMTSFGFSMSALTFLLVFQASQGASRWWEARGHMGKILLSFKHIVTVGLLEGRKNLDNEHRAVQLAKVLMNSLIMQLRSRSPLPDISDVLKSQGLHKAPEDILGLTSHQLQIWGSSSAGGRVMLGWEWLRYEVVGNSEGGPHEAIAPLHALLEAVHGVNKVAHGQGKSPLATLATPVHHIVVCLLLPLQMSFVWHEGWTEQQIDILKSHPHLYILELSKFVLLLSPIICFMGVLRLFSKQMSDPFGNDEVDIDLNKMEASLFAEMDLLIANEEARQPKTALEI